MILVTGAAGKTGLAILRALARRGATTRAFVYRPEQIERVRNAGANSTAVGDLRDASALRLACEGARAVYHLCPNVHPAEANIGRAVIAACREASVEHLIYHSVLHPQTQSMPHHWHKLLVEEAIFESGIPFTILQPCAYMQNVLAHLPAAAEDGVYALPYDPTARLSLVDLEDVAEAAAVVLTHPDHANATYELAGPAALSAHDIADALSKAVGRSVEARRRSMADWTAAAAGSLPPDAIALLQAMFAYYDRYGFAGNPNTLEWLIGRPANPFSAFLARSLEVAR